MISRPIWCYLAGAPFDSLNLILGDAITTPTRQEFRVCLATHCLSLPFEIFKHTGMSIQNSRVPDT